MYIIVYKMLGVQTCDTCFNEEKAKQRYRELEELWKEVSLFKIEKEIPM